MQTLFKIAHFVSLASTLLTKLFQPSCGCPLPQAPAWQ